MGKIGISQRERDPDILWAALKIVCKWEASNYYSESTWQEVLKDSLRLARQDSNQQRSGSLGAADVTSSAHTKSSEESAQTQSG